MARYSTQNRFTLTQLYLEDRKQRAHLKKITDMKKRSGLDNGAPFCLPHLHKTFIKQLTEKNKEIDKENDEKSKKLLSIMKTKRVEPPPPFHPKKSLGPDPLLSLTPHPTDYSERIAKTKGNYSAQGWKKEYREHKGYLKLRKDNSVFTPLDVGVSRKRLIKASALISSKKTTPTSSSINLSPRIKKN